MEEVFRRTRRMAHAWLAYADERTLLLPDILPGTTRGPKGLHIYRPHNSGADNYPYLVATAWFTDRPLYEGRLREMLRNEIRYTNAKDGIPADLDLETGKLGPPSLFGAAEYAKDGLIAITELLGRTPWFYRMADMTADLMKHAPVASDFGPLPDTGAELNGDALQTLVRLAPMTGDRRFLEWAERIGDAYVREVLPSNHGLPGYTWDFAKHEGPDRMRLRDHGNEIVVGLVLLEALESERGRPSARRRTASRSARMLDRILSSANPDGLLYDEIRPSDLAPVLRAPLRQLGLRLRGRLHPLHGDGRGAVPRGGAARAAEPAALPRPRLGERQPRRLRGRDRERPLPRQPRAGARGARLDRDRDRAADRLPAAGRDDRALVRRRELGRTLLLYAMMKTQGCFLDGWQEGVRLGAAREGERLFVSLEAPAGWKGRLRFDHARHRRDLNFARNYVRLNEWPEWYTVDENTLYRLTDAAGKETVRLGSDLEDGIEVAGSGRWIVEPA